MLRSSPMCKIDVMNSCFLNMWSWKVFGIDKTVLILGLLPFPMREESFFTSLHTKIITIAHEFVWPKKNYSLNKYDNTWYFVILYIYLNLPTIYMRIQFSSIKSWFWKMCSSKFRSFTPIVCWIWWDEICLWFSESRGNIMTRRTWHCIDDCSEKVIRSAEARNRLLCRWRWIINE